MPSPQLSDQTAVIGLEGATAWGLDDQRWQSGSWRLDAGPNRTAYSRQLASLVRLCTARERAENHDGRHAHRSSMNCRLPSEQKSGFQRPPTAMPKLDREQNESTEEQREYQEQH